MSPDMKPRSRQVTDGIDATASRGMLRAVGMGDEDWDKPQIGIASSWNEITPCNLSLDRLVGGETPGLPQGGQRQDGRPKHRHEYAEIERRGAGKRNLTHQREMRMTDRAGEKRRVRQHPGEAGQSGEEQSGTEQDSEVDAHAGQRLLQAFGHILHGEGDRDDEAREKSPTRLIVAA